MVMMTRKPFVEGPSEGTYAGSSIAPPAVDRNSSPMEAALQSLDYGIQTCERRLALLAEKLSPIRYRIPMKPAEAGGGDTASNSPLVNQIVGYADTLRLLNESIHELTNEVQL